MTNSIDPDQLPHSAASAQGLHCLLRHVCPNNKGITVYVIDEHLDIDTVSQTQ